MISVIQILTLAVVVIFAVGFVAFSDARAERKKRREGP